MLVEIYLQKDETILFFPCLMAARLYLPSDIFDYCEYQGMLKSTHFLYPDQRI